MLRVPWSFLPDVAEAKTLDELLDIGGLDWETDQLPMTVELIDEENNEISATVAGYRCVTRKDTQQQLGVVGETYKPISNYLAASIFDTVRQEGGMAFSRAGYLGSGERIIVVADFPDPIEVGVDDAVALSLVMSSSHDGSSALSALLSGAVSHTNAAMNLALFGKKDGMKIRHSGVIKSKVKEAERIVAAVLKAYTNFGHIAARLSARELPYTEVEEIMLELVPDPKKKGDALEPPKNARAAKMRGDIVHLYEVGDGASLPTREGTAWGLLCAIMAYNCNQRSTRGDDDEIKRASRMKSVWFGASASFNRKALGLLLERCKTNNA